jgi:hypothetical protein
MPTPTTLTKYNLRSGSPIPKYTGGACPTGAPTAYILQSFGVDVSSVDVWDSIVGLYGSEVMQGLQNFEDTASFRESAYSRISYNGTNNRNTDGDQIFKGTEEHVSEWQDEEAAGLIWIP